MLHSIPEGHINVADLLIAAVIGRVDEEAAVDRAEGLDHALGADRAVVQKHLGHRLVGRRWTILELRKAHSSEQVSGENTQAECAQ